MEVCATYWLSKTPTRRPRVTTYHTCWATADSLVPAAEPLGAGPAGGALAAAGSIASATGAVGPETGPTAMAAAGSSVVPVTGPVAGPVEATRARAVG